jgi:hypothetical protein
VLARTLAHERFLGTVHPFFEHQRVRAGEALAAAGTFSALTAFFRVHDIASHR